MRSAPPDATPEACTALKILRAEWSDDPEVSALLSLAIAEGEDEVREAAR
jgi:hypothetical protein